MEGRNDLPTSLEVATARASRLNGHEEDGNSSGSTKSEKKEEANLVDAETQMVLDEMKAKEEREKMEKLMSGGDKEPEIPGVVVFDSPNAEIQMSSNKNPTDAESMRGEAEIVPKIQKETAPVPPQESPQEEKIEAKEEKKEMPQISIEEAKKNLDSFRKAYAVSREANETAMKKGMTSGEMLAMGKEAADKEREYFEAVAMYRASLFNEAQGKGEANENILKNILLETVTKEAINLHGEKVQAGYESRGGDPKWIKAGKVVAKIGEWYTKQPLKYKLAAGIGLGLLGGLAGGVVASGVFAGQAVLRGVGGAASGVAVERGLGKWQEKSSQKEVLKDFGGNLMEHLVQIGGEADKKILALEKTEKWNRFKRFATAGTVATLIGSGAFAETLKYGIGKVSSFFGGGSVSAQETVTGKVLPSSENIPRKFDMGAFGEGSKAGEIAKDSLKYASQEEARLRMGLPEGTVMPEIPKSVEDVSLAGSAETASLSAVAEGAVKTAESIGSGEYVVKTGDNLWHIVRDKINEGSYFKGLTGSSEELAAKKANVIANLLREVEKDPKAYGINSPKGINFVYPGDHIQMPKGLSDAKIMQGLIERANNLSSDQMKVITESMKKIAGGKVLEDLVDNQTGIKLPSMGLPYEAHTALEDKLNTMSSVTPEAPVSEVPERLGYTGLPYEMHAGLEDQMNTGGTENLPKTEIPSNPPVNEMQGTVLPEEQGLTDAEKTLSAVNEGTAKALARESYNINALGIFGPNSPISYRDIKEIPVKKFLDALPLSAEETEKNFSNSTQYIKIPGHSGVLNNVQLAKYLNLRDFLNSPEVFGKGFDAKQLANIKIGDAMKNIPKELVDKWTSSHK